jgi:hypothetical protein
MRISEIDWRHIGITAATTALTAALCFGLYVLYNDHIILQQVVIFLNNQAKAQSPQPVAPEAKK